MKGKILLALLVSALLALLLSGCVTVTKAGEGAPAPSASSDPAPPPSAPSAEDLQSDTEAKAAIQSSVEALVNDDYKGQSYSCDVLVYDDEQGARYVVSLQIDVKAAPPESAEVVAALEEAINGLGDDRISETQIIAVKDGQIVDSNIDQK